jgi:Flp pilus assembly protein TadG
MDRRQRTRGASTLVEMPLIFTLYFSIVLGIITVAYLVFTYNSLAFMAQQGARWAAVRGSTSGQPATASSVSTYVLSQGVGMNAAVVTTTWNPDNKPGSSVTVNVAFSAVPLAKTYVSSALGLQSSCTIPISR